MRVTDDELRRLYQRRAAQTDRSGCPEAAELAALASGEMAKAERRRLLEHVAGCASCALEVQLAGDAGAWSEEMSRRIAAAPGSPLSAIAPAASEPRRPPSPERAPEASRRRRSRRLLPGLAFAAAAVLAVSAGVWFLTTPTVPPGDVLRGEADEVAPAPGTVLDGAPARLAWPAQAGATGYRFVLFDAHAERLWESPPLGAAELDLPLEARALLRPGAEYLWLVEIEGPAARRELGPYRFGLAP